MTPGPFQILLVILLVLLIFGASRLPNIAENLAKGIKSFKKGLADDDQDVKPKITDERNEKNKDE